MLRRHTYSKLALWFLPLAWLWFRLIDHLRVEWSLNPQYAYGWAVPFLCAYLLWRKLAQPPPPASPPTTLAYQVAKSQAGSPGLHASVSRPSACSDCFSVSTFQRLSFLLLCVLYLPTRLIQEANPDWRLVSWALALEVTGLTLLMVRTAHHASETNPLAPLRLPFELSALNFSAFVFPVCFFLLAVPWPTFIEAPLVQGLMRANVAIVIELLGAAGIPAIQHGNAVEIGGGVLAIGEACSGIRSLQAALMISLFIGEIYRLSIRRRALCVLAGFALAFIFNVGRTLALTWVASAKGLAAVVSWHDPAGVTILLACFLSLWLLMLVWADHSGRAVRPAPSLAKDSAPSSVDSPNQGSKLDAQCAILPAEVSVSKVPSSGPPVTISSVSYFKHLSLFLTSWLVLVELGTELWYRSHEWGMPTGTAWRVEFPTENPTFRELPPSEGVRQILRYDERSSGTWEVGSDLRWQALFLRWHPGRAAAHLARSHTPETCLMATGRELLSQSDLHTVSVNGLPLPFRSYVVKDRGVVLHVFYCLWDDRATAQSIRSTSMTHANRLVPVLQGRRNLGQRLLEVAIGGIADPHEAEAALARELQTLIKIEK